MQKFYSLKPAFFLLLALFSFNSLAADDQEKEVSFSEPLQGFLNYRLDQNNPKYDPLLKRRDFRIVGDRTTVLDGMIQVLKGTSYDLNQSVTKNPVTAEIMKKTLPNVHRTFSNITTLEALKYLIGEHHVLLIDPVLRQIGFDLKMKLPEAEAN